MTGLLFLFLVLAIADVALPDAKPTRNDLPWSVWLHL